MKKVKRFFCWMCKLDFEESKLTKHKLCPFCFSDHVLHEDEL